MASDDIVLRACPGCEKKCILVALQPSGAGLQCPECYSLFPQGAGREVTKKEVFDILMQGARTPA